MMTATFLVEMNVFNSQNAAVSITIATTGPDKCFIQMDSVRRSASARQMER